jgi:glycosyl transferase family 4
MRENDLYMASTLSKANGSTNELRVLILTAMYPTEENPAYGSFVRSQVEALKRAGVEVELLALTGLRKWKYIKGIFQLRHRLSRGSFDLVHAHFGYVGIVARTQWKVPVIVTFHGDDVLGTVNDHGKTTFVSTLMAKACKILSRWVDATVVQSPEMANRLGN